MNQNKIETNETAKSVQIDPLCYDETMQNFKEWSGEWDVKILAIQTSGDEIDLVEDSIAESAIEIKILDLTIILDEFIGKDLLIQITKEKGNYFSLSIDKNPICLLSNQKSDISTSENLYKYCFMLEPDLFTGLEKLKDLIYLYIFDSEEIVNCEPLSLLQNLTHLKLRYCNNLESIDELVYLLNLKQLNLDNCTKLKNLDGLLNSTNLTQLNFRNCISLKNIDGLIDLRNLTHLNLYSCNNLRNVDGLKKLNNLSELDLSYCNSLKNLDGLKNLINLEKLNLYKCNILQNLDGLKDLTKLTQIDLSYCESLQNVDDLKDLTNLAQLDLGSCTTLKNISGLENLTKLTKLVLKWCVNIKNIDSIRGLTDLEHLELNDCENLENLDGLRDLVKLTELDFHGCKSIKNIDGLKNLINLKQLYLYNWGAISNINSLKGLTNLKVLDLGGWESLQDIDDLKDLTNLTQLYLDAWKSLKNIDGLINLTSLTKLYLSDCGSLQNIDVLKKLNNIVQLDLRYCKLINEIKPICKLPNIVELNLDGCISIRDIDLLSECITLKELSYRNNPYSAESVLMATAFLRKDIEYIGDKKEEWLKNIEHTPELEPMASRLGRAFGLCAQRDWVVDYFEKMILILNTREDCLYDTMQKALEEGMACGFPEYKRLFEAAVTDKDAGSGSRFIKPVMSVLCVVNEEAKEWAIDFAEKLLEPIANDQEKVRDIGPVVCLFYANMGMNNNVNDWLERVTEPEAPVWRDRICTALSSFYMKKGDIKQAKYQLAEIKTQVEKDKALSIFAEYLAFENPIEAGEAFDGIVDTVTRFALAEKLRNVSEFTASLHNVYRLFLELESDPAKLSELVNQLLEQHPDSEAVNKLSLQFKPDSSNSENINEYIEKFLMSELIADYTTGLQRKELKEKLLNGNSIVESALQYKILYMLEEEGVVTKDTLNDMIIRLKEGE